VRRSHPSKGSVLNRITLKSLLEHFPEYDAPVQQIDLTDDEIEDSVGYSMTKAGLVDCRAVIAAYKEKNK